MVLIGWNKEKDFPIDGPCSTKMKRRSMAAAEME